MGTVKRHDTMHREDKIGGAPMKTVTIPLPGSLKGFVERQVATEDYGNVSEYFSTLLREARAREEDARLEALLVEGSASGEEIPLTKEFWRELKREAAGIARKHHARKKL
jgi:antitoxin ParD1/3/4